MVILDTSFLYALFQEEDDFHEEAQKTVEGLQEATFSITFLVFQESMTLLTSRVSSNEAAQMAQVLLSKDSPILVMKLDEEYFEETVKLFKELSPHRFSFVDVSLIVLKRDLGAQVLTFDRRLATALEQ